MSTDGDPPGPPAGDAAADQPERAAPVRAGTGPGSAGLYTARPGSTERERAINALAYPLAGTAAAGVVIVIAVAVLDPTPGRHVRGLLILLALVGLLAAACGWVRTVWHGPAGSQDQVAPAANGTRPDAGHTEPPGGGPQIVRHVE